MLRAEASFCRSYEPSVCNMQLGHCSLILIGSCIALMTGAMAEWKYLHQPDSYSSSPVKMQKITCLVNRMTTMERATTYITYKPSKAAHLWQWEVSEAPQRSARNLFLSNCVSLCLEKLVWGLAGVSGTDWHAPCCLIRAFSVSS